jgi:hypothetical protein
MSKRQKYTGHMANTDTPAVRSRIMPVRWVPDLTRLLPEHPGRYDGPRLAVWLLGSYLVVIVVRSLIHLAAPDGGAGSIASIDLSVEGGDNIVGLFGQWGAIQLLLALVIIVLFALALGVESLLRALSGTLKPIETLGVAPGAALNDVMGYAMVVVLYLSLSPAKPKG